MRLIQCVRVYLNIFYVLGQSPYNLSLHRMQRSPSVGFFIRTALPSCIVSIVHFAATAECLYTLVSVEKVNLFRSTDKVISEFAVACDLFRVYCLIRQCCIHRQVKFDAMNAFCDLETIFSEGLHRPLCFIRFRWCFALKSLLIVAIYISSILFKLPSLQPVLLRFKVLQVGTIVGILHVVFHTDLISYFMRQLHLVIERDAQTVCGMNESARNRSIRHRLKGYKIVHFRLWQNTQRLNEYFGYHLLIMIFKSFVHTLFLIFGLIEQPISFSKVIGKLYT